MRISRRSFAAAGLLASSFPRSALAQAKPKLVVVGGGPGGATAAKYVAVRSNGAVDVTLVEPARHYVTCFHSNLYLGGFCDLASLKHSYERLGVHGVALVHETAVAIDRERRSARLGSGFALPYDRLVIAPGIDLVYGSVPGYSEAAAELMPHAWTGEAQLKLLRRQLDALSDGALIVIVPPPNPSRCPPAPYERVSMMAHALKAKGHAKSRIVILDVKESFPEQTLFSDGWEKHYPAMIEWQDPMMHGGIKDVDPSAMTIATDLETYRADLANIIPAQRAGRIAREVGLTDATGWCPVDPASMRSAFDRSIYVVGDACAGGEIPKGAFAASSQAKVAGAAILAELSGGPTPSATYENACWSVIAQGDAVKTGGRYGPRDGKIAALETFVSGRNESVEERRRTEAENAAWYARFTADVFG